MILLIIINSIITINGIIFVELARLRGARANHLYCNYTDSSSYNYYTYYYWSLFIYIVIIVILFIFVLG